MSLVSFDFFVFFTVFFLFTGGRGYTQKTSKHHDRRIDLIQSNAWEIKNGVSSMCENKRRDRRSIDLKFQYLYCFFFSVRFFGRFFCSSKSTGRQWWLSKFCLIGFVDLELERRGSGHVGIRPSSAFVPEARPAVRGRRFPHDVDVHLLPPGAALSVRVETASGTTPATPFALSLSISLSFSLILSLSLSLLCDSIEF